MKKNTKNREREDHPSASANNNLPNHTSGDIEKVIAEIYGLLEEIKQHKSTLKKKGIL